MLKSILFIYYFVRLHIVGFSLSGSKSTFSDLFRGYGKQRKAYVEMFKWVEVDGDIDHDRYDEDANTIYAVVRSGPTVMAGVRATRIVFSECLSLGMFDNAESLSLGDSVTRDEEVIDVTRLTSRYLSGGANKVGSKAAVFKILFWLVRLSRSGNYRFVFTVEDRFVRFLDRNEVEYWIAAKSDNMNLVVLQPGELSTVTKKTWILRLASIGAKTNWAGI